MTKKSNYGWYDCYYCLCEVCNRLHCRNIYRKFTVGYCASMIMRERCPVVKCDYFEHKQKRKVYRIVRKNRKQDILLEKLAAIEQGLDNLVKKL